MNIFCGHFLIFFLRFIHFSNCIRLDQKTTEKEISSNFNKEKLNNVQQRMEEEIGIREIRRGNSVIKVWYNKKSQNKKPTEMSQEEVAKLEEERAQVKKLMAEYRRKMEPELAKQAKKLEKDEAFKKALRDIEAARAKHPEERRKTVPPSIPEINAKNGDNSELLYQGDIELSLEQAQFLLDNARCLVSTAASAASSDGPPNKQRRAPRLKRAAIVRQQMYPYKKWPFNVAFASVYVPFSLDASTSYDLRITIYEAVQLWNDNTCLIIAEDARASPRIHFTNQQGRGCRSEGIGMEPRKTYQHIWLQEPECNKTGAVVHEVGHAIGLIHEHQRPDRDEFLWYYPESAQQAFLSELTKKCSCGNDCSQPYDLGSIMHYTAKTFSMNGQYVLVPKAGSQYLNTIGQEFRPTHGDYLLINKQYCGLEMYQDGSSISTVACSTRITCDNDGFQNPKECWKCICPPGYIGTTCQEVDTAGNAPTGIPNTCNGGILFATSSWQNLVGRVGSERLVEEKTDYAYCHWQIMADHGKTISIQVTAVGTVCMDACTLGNTEIRTSANRGASGIRLCCVSDLGPSGQLTISAPNGYAMISLYSKHLIQNFFLKYRQL